MVTVARSPSSCARSTIRSAASTDPRRVAFWLRWLNVSLAAKAKCTSSRPVVAQAVVAPLVQHQAGVDDALGRARSPATTSSAPAICGTSAGLTKLTASIRGRPAAASRLTSSARTAGASVLASFWSPSRGPTSQIVTRSQHALLRSSAELLVGEPEQAAVDVLVVAAFAPRAPTSAPRRASRRTSARSRARCTRRTPGPRARAASRGPGTARPRRCRRSCRSGRRSRRPR